MPMVGGPEIENENGLANLVNQIRAETTRQRRGAEEIKEEIKEETKVDGKKVLDVDALFDLKNDDDKKSSEDKGDKDKSAAEMF